MFLKIKFSQVYKFIIFIMLVIVIGSFYMSPKSIVAYNTGNLQAYTQLVKQY